MGSKCGEKSQQLGDGSGERWMARKGGRDLACFLICVFLLKELKKGNGRSQHTLVLWNNEKDSPASHN